MHHPTDRIAHTTAFVTPVVEHWLERSFIKSLYVDAHEPSLGDRRAKRLCNMLPRSGLFFLPNHPTHDAVLDNKYMKLFNAKSSALRTFGLRIEQFLTASNINFSDILKILSYFVSNHQRLYWIWCIWRRIIKVLEEMHLHSNTLFLQTYFCVSMLYNIWSWNITW